MADAFLSHLSGSMLLVLLFVAALGLLAHAALIHLTAIVILEEPRFMSAVLTVFIVWCVTIPLELLRIWPPAAMGVRLLAGFGSLKISYAASNARTLVLFVASVVVALLVGLGLGFAKAQLTR